MRRVWLLFCVCLLMLSGVAAAPTHSNARSGSDKNRPHHTTGKGPVRRGRVSRRHAGLRGAASARTGSDPYLFGDQAIESFIDYNRVGTAEAFPFSNSTTGTATSIHVYVDSGNRATTLIAGLYSNNNGHPGTKLRSAQLYSPTAGAWNTVSFPGVNVNAGSTYWIAVTGHGGALWFRDRANGPCYGENSASSSLTRVPSTWSSGPQRKDCPISAYAMGTVPSSSGVTPPGNTALPQVSGTATQGNVLTATTGSWSGSRTAYGYQWQDCDSSGANCTSISGATSSSYTLTSSDVGHTIRAVVVATNAGGSTRATSGQTAVVTNGTPLSSIVSICGMQLCLHGTPFVVKGATAYGQYGNASGEIAAAQSGNLNTLELVEFDSQYHVLSDTESAATWNSVDAFIAAARAAHMYVILNLSEYGQSLQAAGYNMSSPASGAWPNLGWQGDWNQYLQFIANRVNTVSGIAYKNDPTLAMVEIWGEIPAPNYPSPVGTTAQMQTFYANAMSEWQSLAPNILVSSGGFSYLNDSGSGIPWQSIMSTPSNATCDIEINSSDDRNSTVGEVTHYCQQLGKPWFLAAWSACSKPSQGSWDINDWMGATPAATDARMAAHAQDMYGIAAGYTPATYPAIGSDFWNLGTQTYSTCDLGPSSAESPSQTWAVVRRG